MCSSLISRSPHLMRLRDEGLTLEVADGYLLVHDIPYVNATRETLRGTLVFRLDLTADVAVTPSDHTAHFIGEAPCDMTGARLEKIINQSSTQQLTPRIKVDHYFSAKPRSGQYVDYYEKVTAYANMLAGHAQAIDPSLKAQVFKPALAEEGDGPFVYSDTATTRAGIALAAGRLAGQRVAIVGLGGTGAYVLDLIAKTPVAEIHLYDADRLQQHNAFRYPGAVSFQALQDKPAKVDYLAGVYSELHRGVRAHAVMIEGHNVAELIGYDAIFVCVDRSEARRLIAETVGATGTVVFDTGMGVQLTSESQLFAIVRLSVLDPQTGPDALKTMPLAAQDGGNLYATSVQVGDLNALNAFLAVEAWKKRLGFYAGQKDSPLTTYTTATGAMASTRVGK